MSVHHIMHHDDTSNYSQTSASSKLHQSAGKQSFLENGLLLVVLADLKALLVRVCSFKSSSKKLVDVMMSNQDTGEIRVKVLNEKRNEIIKSGAVKKSSVCLVQVNLL